MINLRRKTAIAAAVLGLAGVVAANPAAAQPGAITVAGAGAVSPGISLTPTNQSFTFDGTAVVASAPGAGTYSCSFSGSSSGPETSLQGAGTGSGICSGAAGTVTTSFGYTRAGGAIAFTGTVSGAVNGQMQCALGLVPTSNPTTSFHIAGQCTLT